MRSYPCASAPRWTRPACRCAQWHAVVADSCRRVPDDPPRRLGGGLLMASRIETRPPDALRALRRRRRHHGPHTPRLSQAQPQWPVHPWCCAPRGILMEGSNDAQLSVVPSPLPEGRRVLRMQPRGAQRRPTALVLSEKVVCPTSVFTGGAMSHWYDFTRIAAALGLTLAFAIAAFADDPGFPAPTGDPAFVPPGAKLERLFDGGAVC